MLSNGMFIFPYMLSNGMFIFPYMLSNGMFIFPYMLSNGMFIFPYMLSNGVFYLPIHAFVYELQVEMYLIVTPFVPGANSSMLIGVTSVLNYDSSKKNPVFLREVFLSPGLTTSHSHTPRV